MSIASLASPIADPQQLASMLTRLSPQQLQEYAQAHQNDMMIVSMVMAEQSRRQKQTTAMQGAQPQQPSVREQVISQGLPEDSGIAQLPAPNMQNMAGGGIVAFAGGKEVKGDRKAAFMEEYGPAAEYAGERLGVDPQILLSQWALESDYGRKTVGQFNLGNIKDVTGKGPRALDKAEGSRDAYKSYDSPEDFAADYAGLISRRFPEAMGAGSDVAKFSAGLKPGKQGGYATDPNYAAKLAATSAGLGGTPQAQDAAAQTGEARTPDPSAGFNRRAERTWGQVPAEALANTPKSAGNLFSSLGQIVQHPLDTLGNVADVGAGAFQHALPDSWTNRINSFGTPEEQALAAKQYEAASAAGQFLKSRFGSEQGIKETLATDPVGAAADVAGIFAGGAGAARRLAALGGKRKLVQTANAAVTGAEGLQDVAAVKQAAAAEAAAKAQGVMGPQRLLPTEPAGALPPTKDALMRAELNARQNARKMAGVKATEDAAAASGLAATEAGAAAAAARTAAEANIAAAKAPMVVKPLPKKLKGLAGAAAAAKLPEMFDPNAPTKDMTPAAPVVPEDLSKDDKKNLVDTAKATVPAAERKKTGFDNDDWMMLGLQLLAGNKAGVTPFEALGKAGIATLGSKKEREKAEREQESQKFIDELRQSQAKLAGAQAEYFGEDKKVGEAIAEADKMYDNWLATEKANKMTSMELTSEKAAAARQQFLRDAYERRKIPLPPSIGAAGPRVGASLKYDAATGTIK